MQLALELQVELGEQVLGLLELALALELEDFQVPLELLQLALEQPVGGLSALPLPSPLLLLLPLALPSPLPFLLPLLSWLARHRHLLLERRHRRLQHSADLLLGRWYHELARRGRRQLQRHDRLLGRHRCLVPRLDPRCHPRG